MSPMLKSTTASSHNTKPNLRRSPLMNSVALSLSLSLTLLLSFVMPTQAQPELPFSVETVTSFDEPWAMAFLPDGRMSVTEKKGTLMLVTRGGDKTAVYGLPDVVYGGQGGLGD